MPQFFTSEEFWFEETLFLTDDSTILLQILRNRPHKTLLFNSTPGGREFNKYDHGHPMQKKSFRQQYFS